MCLRLFVAEACSAWECLDIVHRACNLLRSILFLLRCAFKMLPLSLGWCKLPGRGHLFPWWLWWEYLQLQVLECCSGSALLQPSKHVKGFCKECVASRSNASCWRAVFTGCQPVVGFTSMGDKLVLDSGVSPPHSHSCLESRYGQGAHVGLRFALSCSAEVLSWSAYLWKMMMASLVQPTYLQESFLHPVSVILMSSVYMKTVYFLFECLNLKSSLSFCSSELLLLLSLDCKHCM